MCTPLYILPLIASLGCQGDDFGRTRSTFYHQDMHSWVGSEATISRGGFPSELQLTDAERQLRDLAYYFIEPPHRRPAWKAVYGDYLPLPAPWRQDVFFDRTAYGRMMIDEPHRSQVSAYAGLIEDVRNDMTQLDQFVPVAMRVDDLDVKRGLVLKKLSDISTRELLDAQARMRENALVVQWAQIALQQRVSSYRWALERLAIHAPDNLAAEADRLIIALSARAATAWTSGPPVVSQALRTRG